MTNDFKNGKLTASLNGESDLEGKIIIDSRGEKIGTCKAVSIGTDGKIGLSFEIEINGKNITPSQIIPYNAIQKITDIIELNVPINIKIAQSADEISQILQEPKRESLEEQQFKSKQQIYDNVKELEFEKKLESSKLTNEQLFVDKNQENESKKVETEPIQPLSTFEKQKSEITSDETNTMQFSKKPSNVIEEVEVEKEEEKVVSKESKEQLDIYSTNVRELINGLKEEVKKIQQLFHLIEKGDSLSKIEAITALTELVRVSPELGLSLLPKLMTLSDSSQQDVRMVVAKNLEIIGETKPVLFKEYFLEILQNAYDEPMEEIRDQLIKTLHEVANKMPEIASYGLEEFLYEVIIGKRVPEVPAKVIHDTTLKVVSGIFPLTRIAIKVKLDFIVKGGKLGERNAEELEDYNATLIGLTLIESFTIKEVDKIVKSPTFKNLGPIFVEVIHQMIEAYKEGSFKMLNEVVDKKIEIPLTIIEKFYEIKISHTLEGAMNIPLEVFLENSFLKEEEAEQLIYRLVMQKRVNAAITMNNGKAFITSLEHEVLEKKETPKSTSKPKITTKEPIKVKATSEKTKQTGTTNKKDGSKKNIKSEATSVKEVKDNVQK